MLATSFWNTRVKISLLINSFLSNHSIFFFLFEWRFVQKCSNLFSMVFLLVSLSDFVVFCISFLHLQLVEGLIRKRRCEFSISFRRISLRRRRLACWLLQFGRTFSSRHAARLWRLPWKIPRERSMARSGIAWSAKISERTSCSCWCSHRRISGLKLAGSRSASSGSWT